MHNFEVGQKIWYVPRDRFESSHFREITKVGYRWIYLNRRTKFDRDTLFVDGGRYGSPAKIYLDKQDWENEIAATTLRQKLHKALAFGISPRFSLEQLRQAAEALGIDPD